MPSDLRFEPIPVSMAPLGPESTPPDLIGTQILQNQLTFELDETDELYEGYGRVPNAFPYRSFSCYSRQRSEQKIQGAILENRYLRIFSLQMAVWFQMIFERERTPLKACGTAFVRPLEGMTLSPCL